MYQHKDLYADSHGTTPTSRMEEEARKTGHGDTRFNFKHKKRVSSTGRSGTTSCDRSELSKSIKAHGKKVRVIDDDIVKISAQGDKVLEDTQHMNVKKGSHTIDAEVPVQSDKVRRVQ